MNLKRAQNRKNSTWLHQFRNEILELSKQFTLEQTAEKITALSGKKTTRQAIHTYLKKYPREESLTKPIQKGNAQIATNSTTEKEIEPLSVTKQAADEVSSSVEESRVVTKPDFETPTEPQQKAESEPAPKSTNPFSRLKGKVGKSKPDFIPESSKYS
ncbi:TPA: hypothetical protein WI034_001509 [Neisseria meningitidis]